MAFEVGYEPSLYFAKRPATSELKRTVSKFIAFLRKNPRDPIRFRAKASELAKRFRALLGAQGAGLVEISPSLSSLRSEVMQAVLGLTWPDFSWMWDSAVPLLAMALAFGAGPVGRKELPLPFPPETVTTLTKQLFYDLVAPYMVTMMPLDINADANERAFHNLATQSFFCPRPVGVWGARPAFRPDKQLSLRQRQASDDGAPNAQTRRAVAACGPLAQLRLRALELPACVHARQRRAGKTYHLFVQTLL